MILLALLLAATPPVPLPLKGYQLIPDRTVNETYATGEFRLKDGEDRVQIDGAHFFTWLLLPDGTWQGRPALAQLETALQKDGWKEIVHSDLEATFRRGENEYARLDFTEDQLVSNIAEYVKKIPPPVTLTLKAPGAKAEKVDEKSDFPWLGHFPGSELKGTSQDDGPFMVNYNGEQKIVASGSVTKEYSEPEGLTNLLFVVAYKEGLKKAGWEVLDTAVGGDAMLLAHYSKVPRDLWLYMHQSWEGWKAQVGDAGASALRQQLDKDCKVAVYGLNFDFDKATLRPDSEPVLAQIRQLFTADAAFKAELSGHTDNVGNGDYNQKLSLARANAVKAWLVKNGVDGARITTAGYGASQPVASNDSDEGRARNRRVQIARPGCSH